MSALVFIPHLLVYNREYMPIRFGKQQVRIEACAVQVAFTQGVLMTGLLAWQFQLEGQKLKGILLLHLVLACVSTAMIWVVWWVHFRARQRAVFLPGYRIAVELLAVALVALTGHLGGFLSGVNLPG
jgi:hypothetical protein